MRMGGIFNIKVVDKGKLISEAEFHNQMTTASLAAITGLVGNVGSQNPFTYLALGTSSTAVSSGQTALIAEIVDSGLARTTATVTRTTSVSPAVTNDTLSLTYTWTASGSKTINEVGVFNASSSGVMLARALTGAQSVVSGNQVIVTYTWQAVGN